MTEFKFTLLTLINMKTPRSLRTSFQEECVKGNNINKFREGVIKRLLEKYRPAKFDSTIDYRVKKIVKNLAA